MNFSKPAIFYLLISSLMGTAIGAADAQICPRTAEQAITPADASPEGLAGNAISVDGVWAAVSRKRDDVGSTDVGSVYIYRFDPLTEAWQEYQKLSSSDGAAGDAFGQSVALDGNHLLVGAYFKDEGGLDFSGAAYAFGLNPETGMWEETQKILPADLELGDRFGESLAVDGNRALIGATFANDAPGSGAAYFFRFDETQEIWVEEQKVVPDVLPQGFDLDFFGWSVDLDGEVAVVGTATTEELMAAYVFRYGESGWVQEQRLSPDNLGADFYGWSVSLDSNRILVGTPFDLTFSGSVYAYEYNGSTWQESQIIEVWDEFPFATNFGIAVELEGDRALIGAPQFFGFDDAHAFEYQNVNGQWELVKRFSSDGVDTSSLGEAVAFAGPRALIGDTEIDLAGQDSGGFLSYRLNELALDMDPLVAPAGTELNILVQGGAEGEAGFLFARKAGSMNMILVDQGIFSSACGWQTTLNLPVGLAEGGILFQAVVVDAEKGFLISNQQRVRVP